MFSGIMAKISAGLAVVAGVLFVLLGMEKSRRKKAEHENRIKDTVEDIGRRQVEFETEVQENEQERIEEKVTNSQFASRRDRASKL